MNIIIKCTVTHGSTPLTPVIPARTPGVLNASTVKKLVLTPGTNSPHSPLLMSCLKRNAAIEKRSVGCQTDGFFSRFLIKDLKRNTTLDFKTFDGLVDVINLTLKTNSQLKLSFVSLHPRDQLLMTLMKLRCNFTLQHLADLFDIGATTAGNVFRSMIKILATIFKPLVQGIPPADVCKIIMPKCYQNNLTKDCTMSVDCTDIRINNIRSDFSKIYATRSNYRNCQSLKCLIAILPSNCICFCSSLFPGRISDREICVQSGFLEKLSPGHKLAVDKGFLIEDILPPYISLCMPSFKQTGQQFTHPQVFRSMAISSARTHVERVNERIKNFRILGDFPYHYLDIASDVMLVICGIVNLTSPLQAENIKPLHDLFKGTNFY